MAKVTLVTLCLAIAFSAAYCSTVKTVTDDYFYFQLENGTVIKEDLTKLTVGHKAVSAKDVTLYLYTSKTGKDSPCAITSDSCTNWKNCGFDAKKKTVILVHGYTHSYQSETVQGIKNALLVNRDVNTIIVDYNPVSSPYLSAVSAAKGVGQFAAKIITFGKDSCGLNIKNAECVGHSLGSHVCGLLGAALPQKLTRIVALDPAAPVIGAYGVDGKLDISDADNVQCIHSSSDGLAITKAFCSIDFYPCAAKNQYGCDSGNAGQALAGGCDHAKACTMYADSILHANIFKADCECSSADGALSKSCSKYGVTTYMGETNSPSDKGIHYLDTHPIYTRLLA